MNNPANTINHHFKPVNWRALEYFNFYRILISGLFVVLVHTGQLPSPLGSLSADLFSISSHLYLLQACVISIFIRYEFLRFNLQIAIHALIDVIMLTLLMYSSDGLSSGFGMLLIIAVAGGSILRAGKISILFAAIASIAVLSHELYLQFFKFYYSVNYTHAGILGATFFITAIIGNLLAARVRESEALAEKRAVEINELAKLNEHIVQRMQSGILVLDKDMNVLLMNESSKKLLGQQDKDTNKVNIFVDSYLREKISSWLDNQQEQNTVITDEQTQLELQVSFIKLIHSSGFQILVFLEDMSKLRERAQHLKLASLGRLTASIAHEIRNPLGAINHAGQLLQESNNLDIEDKRLTEIINEHSIRVNNIIENVMRISRRDKSSPEKIELKPWLERFIEEFISRHDLEIDDIYVEYRQKKPLVKMDATQLHQVIWNLCENALRYSKGKPLLKIECDVSSDTQRPFIDIIDNGEGISKEIKQQLFEPFFTTESKGTGLGLYLARELCEANQASLGLNSTSSKGSIFRVSFMNINKHNELK